MKKSLIPRTASILLMVALLMTLCACGTRTDPKGSDELVGETETNETIAESEPCTHVFEDGICTICGEKCAHLFENGKCSVCGIKAIDLIAGFIKDSPDSFSDGAYIKSLYRNSFTDAVLEKDYYLGFAYVEDSNTLIIQGMKDTEGESEAVTISINGGVIARTYNYLYSLSNNYAGYSAEIGGIFDATRLSSTQTFDYSSSSGNSAMFIVYDDIADRACTLAQETITMLDEFLEYYELGFASIDLNFK